MAAYFRALKATDTIVFTHTLSIPIKGVLEDGKVGDIHEISFREPNAADMIYSGDPVKHNPFDEKLDITFNVKEMTEMMWRLSGVPVGTLGNMTPGDWKEVAWGLAGFFVPYRARKKAPSTTPQEQPES